jgi:D-sedoheptulose 7-phosphate isomerase
MKGVRSSMQAEITEYLDRLWSLLADLDARSVAQIAEILACARGCKRVFIIGNGGSAATASHFACDLSKNAGGFAAIALTDHVPTLTALANDLSYQDVFSKQLEALASPDDILVAISVSGNSPNIIQALGYARSIGMTTVGLLGFEGGWAKNLCDACVVVKSYNYERVEDVHLAICHALTTCFKEAK